MQRSLLRPLRTRRAHVQPTPVSHRRVAPLPLTTKTRKTLAAVGVFWLAFAASTHAAPPAEAAPAVTPSPPSPI